MTLAPALERGPVASIPKSQHEPNSPRLAEDGEELRYGLDTVPGIRRLRTRSGFRYVLPGGEPLRDPDELARVRALAIPPAWTDVWIAPDARSHLQATGRDQKGRKQYRYHPRWQEERGGDKYARMVEFGTALPRIRRAVSRHLRLRGYPRERVLAVVVSLLDQTALRVGNASYERENGSYGLTTLTREHATVGSTRITFTFVGKSGKPHRVTIVDRRLARVVRGCEELPGQHLFSYVGDDGDARDVTSADVNEYLRSISGGDFTAKDFRTWAGSVSALAALVQMDPPGTKAEAKRAISAAMREVARELGNTPAVCRASYVHPRVLEAYAAGTLAGDCGAKGRLDRRGAERCLRALLAVDSAA
ncbi:MAG: DNA topoisomerase IB [Dehalococcoidia bacterium]|nr:DNA topoisomerase IB [Dehalococcoidia bacterium]